MVERVTSHVEQTALSLVSLPGAVSQQAELVIEAAADVGISIRESGVNVMPSGDDPITPTTRATIQYAPENTAAKVVITRKRHALVPNSAAVVLHRRIESQYDVAGQAWHLATFQLRSAGEDSIELSVPEECTITRLWLNGRPLPRPTENSSSIPLPIDDPSSTLAVEYRTDEPSLAGGGTLGAQLANVDLPILTSQWLLHVPPGFELADVTGGLAEPTVHGFSWSERLFGPLGRGTSAAAIDPFSARGWGYLAARFSWTERSAAVDFASRFSELSRGTGDDPKSADWGKLMIAADGMAPRRGHQVECRRRGARRSSHRPPHLDGASARNLARTSAARATRSSGRSAAVHAGCRFADQPSLGHDSPRSNSLDRAGPMGNPASRPTAGCAIVELG